MNTFQTESLEAHNEARLLHGAPPLKYSEKLSRKAEKYAKDLAKIGVLKVSDNNDEGENLASIKGGDLNGKAVTDLWLNERRNYDYDNPEANNTTGNFTQLVWVDTRKMGIFKATGKDGTNYVVARYSPPGNYSGLFKENVLPEGSDVATRQNNSCVPAASIPDSKVLKKDLLKYINEIRECHGAHSLKWDDKIASEASKMAKEILDCRLSKTDYPSADETYGRILLIATGGLPSLKQVCKSWYKGSSKYDYSAALFTQESGSFTQLVWTESKFLGAGVAHEDKEHVLVAYFDPPGNVKGKFEDCVRQVVSGKNKPFD